MLKEANSITDDALIAMYVTWLDRTPRGTVCYSYERPLLVCRRLLTHSLIRSC